MIRSSTKGETHGTGAQTPTCTRPQTAFQSYQAAGGHNTWYTSYMRVLNDHRRIVIRQTKRPTGLSDIQAANIGLQPSRPATTALVHRETSGHLSDTVRMKTVENKLKSGDASPKEGETPMTAAAALMQFGHNQRPPMPVSKDPLTDYILGATLGQGSFASVKKAVHKQTSTPVAIKTYEKYRLIDAHRKKGVVREIKILNQMDHTNIVKLMKVIEGPRHLHLVMEFIDGQSLYTYLKQKQTKRLTEADAKEVFSQVMDGLGYLHERGVSHRDLKLQNVLLDQKRVVKIIDFGFSTQVAEDRKIKMYCGTPNYMAPEIVERKEYSGAPADIWAAGVLLYAMLCGEFPFKGLSDRELYKRIQSGGFIVPPHVSASGKDLIAAMLSTDPEARPAAKAVLTFPWFSGAGLKTSMSQPALMQRPATTPILFRQRGSALPNPLASYDQEIIARLVIPI